MWRRLALVSLLVAAHIALYRPTEPFYNNDETRNLMTGVFFHDALHDLPAHPRDYAVAYYLQYPALGLLSWPPFFHAVLGLFMWPFGTSLLVGKVVIGLFAIVALLAFDSLVVRTHGAAQATSATLILGLSPLFFELSSYVMLEVPTLACALVAIRLFVRYLDLSRSRDLYLASACASLAALTRFDGFYLVPIFLILAWAWDRMDLLLRREMIPATLLALALVVPFYALCISQVGNAHGKAILEGTYPGASRPFAPHNFIAYPAMLPGLIGWFALIPAVLGLGACLRAPERQASWPYLAMLISTYAMIVAVSEIIPRHAIYWMPAVALFAARGLALVAGRMGSPRLLAPMSALVVAGTFWTTSLTPTGYVRGYEAAARYVLGHATRSKICLFDGALDGDFIYQVRRLDPGRRFWVLRGDKLFYSTLSDRRTDYREVARDEADLLARLARYDPEFIVVENPQVGERIRMAGVLRAALREYTERFRIVTSIPIESNLASFRGVRLEIYRNTVPNEHPERNLEIDLQMLGHPIRAVVPPSTFP
jgi:4-amino-4-deoxy-L-arabinose transferase-like glycosyltransferase